MDDNIQMSDNIQMEDIQMDSIKINVEKIQTTTKTIQTTTTQTIQTETKTEIKCDGNLNVESINDDNTCPPYLYVLSDNVGYVGTYYSISDIEEITSSYHLVSFMVQCFKTSKTSDLLTVWVVLYKDIDAVAYVSNNRLDAVKVHSTLMQMGLAYMDSIDYWKQNVGLSKSAKERLDVIHSIKDKHLLDDSYNIFIQKLDLSTENMPNGPIDCILNETQKITIMDAIIPSLIPQPLALEDLNDESNEEIKDSNEEIKDSNEEIENSNEEIENSKDSNDDKTREEKIENLEKQERELYSRIKNQKNSEIKFCEKCQDLSNTIYNKLDSIDEASFNKLLILFIANHCYHCFHNIRDRHRKKNHELINKNINIPIDSPFVSANRDNTPKVDSKLEETVKNITNLLNLPTGEDDLKNLNVDELLAKYSTSEKKQEQDDDDEDVEDVEI